MLRKYCEKIVISYDSDGAGQSATLRGLEILKNVGCDVRILQMEGAKDPDEFVIKYGNGRFNLLVQNAISLIEFRVKVLKQKYDLNNINDKIKFLKETAKLIQTIDSKIEQEIYIDRISKEYKISKEALYAEINKLSGNKTGSKLLEKNIRVVTKQKQLEIPKILQKREDAIVAVLVSGNKEAYKQIRQRITPEDLKIEINRRIVETLFNKYENEGEVSENILDLFNEDQEAVNKITAIMAQDEENGIDKKTLENLINVYEKEKLTLLKAEIIQNLNATQDNEEQKNLEKELNDVIFKLDKLK